MTSFVAGETLTAADLNTATQQVVGRWRRSSTGGSVAGTTEDEVIRLDDVPVLQGVCYFVWLMCHPNSTVANDTVQVTVRHTTDGSTPTTASSILPGMRSFTLVPTGGGTGPLYMAATYTPGTDQQLSLLVTVARSAGTGTVELFADTSRLTELVVERGGVDPGTGPGADL